MGKLVEKAASDDRIKVSIADYAIGTGELLTTSGLGSCLGIALYDDEAGVGGLVHPMLPRRDGDTDRRPERFVDSGIELVVEELSERGANQSNLVAKVTGGAAIVNFDNGGGPSMGERNIDVARDVLQRENIELAGEEVGGDCGRTMRVDTATGTVVVKRTDGEDTVI